jgi:hypothetical protein
LKKEDKRITTAVALARSLAEPSGGYTPRGNMPFIISSNLEP